MTELADAQHPPSAERLLVCLALYTWAGAACVIQFFTPTYNIVCKSHFCGWKIFIKETIATLLNLLEQQLTICYVHSGTQLFLFSREVLYLRPTILFYMERIV